MKIISVDQSFTHCAYTVFENNAMTEFGVFTSDKTLPMHVRAFNIASQIVELYNRISPDKILFEDLAYGSVGNATRDLAGLLFTIRAMLHQTKPDFEHTVVPPTAVKKKALGKGKGTKTDMIGALPDYIAEQFKNMNYKKTTGLGDLADAYWIGQTVVG